jgi:hypothetical protein
MNVCGAVPRKSKRMKTFVCGRMVCGRMAGVGELSTVSICVHANEFLQEYLDGSKERTRKECERYHNALQVTSETRSVRPSCSCQAPHANHVKATCIDPSRPEACCGSPCIERWSSRSYQSMGEELACMLSELTDKHSLILTSFYRPSAIILGNTTWSRDWSRMLKAQNVSKVPHIGTRPVQRTNATDLVLADKATGAPEAPQYTPPQYPVASSSVYCLGSSATEYLTTEQAVMSLI